MAVNPVLKARAEQVRDEIQVGANTAARVGGLLVDMVDEMGNIEDEGGEGFSAAFVGEKLVLNNPEIMQLIRLSKSSIEFPVTEENNTATDTFVVSGKNLTEGIVLTLSDLSGMFSIDTNSISAADANTPQTITVTYAPTAPGNHSATILLQSGDVTNEVEIQGTAVEEIVPILLVNDGQNINIGAEDGETATMTVPVVGMNLGANASVALAITDNIGMTIDKHTLTADGNGSINTTLTLTYTADTSDVSGTLTATATATGTVSVNVVGKVLARLATGCYWDDGMLRYTVLSDNTRVSATKNPNATASGSITFPASVSDTGKNVYDSGGNAVSASEMSYRVYSVPGDAFRQAYGITGLTFEAGGVGSIGDNAFNMHPNNLTGTANVTFNGAVSLGQYSFFKFRVGNIVMLGNVTGWTASFGGDACTFNTLDFGEDVTAVNFTVWSGLHQKTGSKIICRSTTPPTTSGTMDSGWQGATLYVPDAAISTYQANAVWGSITTIKGLSELS